MLFRRPLFAILLCLPLVTGCMTTAIHTVLMPDGSGKMVFDLDLDPRRLPFFVKDPLRHVQTVDFMRRSNLPGMVAWGPPQRTTTAERDRVVLTAYFRDINDLWLYKREDGVVLPVLRFAYDAEREPGILHLRPDLAEDLDEPIPLPKLDSVGINMDLGPSVIQGLTPILKPLLADMLIDISLTTPGDLTRADGFREMVGRTASLRLDRDQFLQALTKRAGVIVDEPGILREDPVLQWEGSQVSDADVESFRHEIDAAREWWDAHRPRREPVDSE